MKPARLLGLLCCLSAAPASAEPAAMATCADFQEANAEQRAAFVFMAGQWAAGFAQAKVLSCATARDLPASPQADRMRAAECNFSNASQRFLQMPAAEQERRLTEICQRFPNNNMTMNTMLIFADINAATLRN